MEEFFLFKLFVCLCEGLFLL